MVEDYKPFFFFFFLTVLISFKFNAGVIIVTIHASKPSVGVAKENKGEVKSGAICVSGM